MNKDEEIEQWRDKHRFYTEDTMRKLASEEQQARMQDSGANYTTGLSMGE